MIRNEEMPCVCIILLVAYLVLFVEIAAVLLRIPGQVCDHRGHAEKASIHLGLYTAIGIAGEV